MDGAQYMYFSYTKASCKQHSWPDKPGIDIMSIVPRRRGTLRGNHKTTGPDNPTQWTQSSEQTRTRNTIEDLS